MNLLKRAFPFTQALVAAMVCPALCSAAQRDLTNEEIRARLKDILARPEFSPEKQADWSRRFLEWLADILGWLSGLRGASPLAFWLLLLGSTALLILLACHIAWTVRGVMLVDGAAQERARAAAQRRLLSLVHWEDAKLRAAQGDFTEAIRFLFLSLVYHFDESGRVLFQQAFTNREYLALFDDRPDIRSGLSVFVDALDKHWYGQQPTERALYEQCLAQYLNLK